MPSTSGDTCTRPDCSNPLGTGKYYCSRKCSAIDRSRVKKLETAQSKLSWDARSMIPAGIVGKLVSGMGRDAFPVMEEMAEVMLETKDQAPPLLSYLTESGDLEPHYYGILKLGSASYRPDDALSFEKIDRMLKNGQVAFALEMKKAWLRSALRDKLSWDIQCADEKMQETVKGLVGRVMQKHSAEFMEALPYGVYFGEKIFDRQKAQYWGLDGNEPIIGYKKINPIHPKSIKEISYTKDGKHFNGFVQTGVLGDDIDVRRELSLVLPYNSRFRNLWGHSILEQVYPYWAWYEIAFRSLMRYLERMGTPVTVCYAPARGQIRTPDGTAMGTMKYAFLVAGNVSKSNAIAIPGDIDPDTKQPLWKLDYLSDDKRGAQFIEAINLLGTAIVKSTIIGDRAIEQPAGGPGSYNTAQAHFAVTMLHNEHVLAEFLNNFNAHLIPQLVTYNGTQSTPPATMVTEGLDPFEKDRLFQLISIAGNQAGAEGLKKVDWEEIYKINNIPVLTQEEVEEIEKQKMDKEREHMAMQQEFAQPALPKPKGPGSPKPGLPPNAQKTVKQSADYLLYQLSSGAQVPLILSNDQAQEMVDRFSDRPFVLYNPYHDAMGRFSSKQRSAQTVANIGEKAWVAGLATGVAGLAAAGISKAVRVIKKKDAKSTAISFTFKGKKREITYEQIEKGGSTVLMAGIIGFEVGIVVNMIAQTFANMYGDLGNIAGERAKEYQRRADEAFQYEQARRRASSAYKEAGRAYWPSGATDKQFKSMYRDLAKAFHPDVSGAPGAAERMQLINNYYDQKNWAELEKMHSKLERAGYTEEQIFIILSTLYAVSEMHDEGADYYVFKHGGEDAPPFVVHDDEVIIDAITMDFLIEMFETLGSSVEKQLEEGVLLFNPYHDELGRFASKAGSVATAFGKAAYKAARNAAENPALIAAVAAAGTSMAAAEAKYSSGDRKRIRARTDAALARVPDEYKNPKLKAIMHKSIGGFVLASRGQIMVAMAGGFVNKTGSGMCHIAPMISRWFASEAKTDVAESRRILGESIVAHEAIHSRPRTGKGWPGPLGQFTSPMEEGMTELLLEAKAGYPSGGAYRPFSDGMAKIAMTISGNKKSAIDWIDSSHKKQIGLRDLTKQIRSATGKNINMWNVFAYLKWGGGALEKTIGKKSGASARLTREFITRGGRRQPDLDLSMGRLFTGAVEGFGAAVAVNSVKNAIKEGFYAAYEDLTGKEVPVGVQIAGVFLEDDNITLEELEDWRECPVVSLLETRDVELIAGVMGVARGMAADYGFTKEEVEQELVWAAEGLMVSLGQEEEMLEDEEVIELFNPYHDEKGLFTTADKSAVGSSEAAKYIGNVSKKISGVPKDMEVKEFKNNKSAKTVLGDHRGIAAWKDGTIYVTPTGAKVLNKYPQFKEYAMTHESIHGRIRGNGKPVPPPLSARHSAWEEATTEMLTSMALGYRVRTGYDRHVMAVSQMARMAADGNREKAWEWINKMHMDNYKTPKIPLVIKRGVSKDPWEDYKWLMQKAPKKLQEDPEWAELWRESERIKWKYTYGHKEEDLEDVEEEKQEEENAD